MIHSWLRDAGPKKSGEEEARPCQGTEDACLGQEIVMLILRAHSHQYEVFELS